MLAIRLSLILAVTAICSQAQILEWIAVIYDPPGSTPTTFYRSIQVQAGTPTKVAPFVPQVVNTGRFVSVFARKFQTPLNETAWCLDDINRVTIVSLAVEITGLLYNFNPPQKEISATFPAPGCASAIIVSAITPQATPLRVGALVFTTQ